MDVRITIEDRNSSENKTLLSWLHNNIDTFRRDMRMCISTISTEEMKSQGISLPRVIIGSRPPVVGGKKIMDEIKQAYSTITQMNLQDPVEQVWREAIRKTPEGSGEESRPEDELAQQFTLQSNMRQKAREDRTSRAGSRPLPPEAKPVASRDRPRGMPAPPRSATRGPQTTAERAAQAVGASEFMTTDDPNSPELLETDPWMKKYWQNQQITAGT